ncbi:MAG: hypothetical protein AMJ46_02390 [Latescibacteria bacterium DG_63]|nr:MAG: hypothetical protein AMJ46_02390 [Latescibacteria bacterium DG_63]
MVERLEHRERRFLDPLVVSKLSNLDLRARLVVEGFIAGLHRSPYKGFSVEFAEHRQYMPGDPIRNIDWKVFARRDRFYVKEFEEETNLRAYILVDASASMGYSSGTSVTKLHYACSLAAALTYLMLRQQDSVGLLTFTSRIKKYIPPRSAKGHLNVILTELERLLPEETTNVSKSLELLAHRIRRRGLIILFSDLMDDQASVLSAVKHFRYRKHEVIVFHLLDESEMEFPFEEELAFVDMETHEEIIASSRQIGTRYKRIIKNWTAEYRRQCHEHLVEYALLSTSTPYDVALTHYLEKRARLH